MQYLIRSCFLYIVVDSMKSVLKKTMGSDFEEQEEEPVMESNPLARGKSSTSDVSLTTNND